MVCLFLDTVDVVGYVVLLTNRIDQILGNGLSWDFHFVCFRRGINVVVRSDAKGVLSLPKTW